MIIRIRFPISFSRLHIRPFTSAKSLLQSQHQQPSEDSSELRFHGNTSIEGSKEERMQSLFGGRIKGDVRTSSSRTEVGEPRWIAGILVPDKPTEPDNCCMSGCVNCVWEQYNDDVKDWRHKRNEAVNSITHTEDKWPADFNPPLAKLDIKNVPKELRTEKRRLSKAKKISTSSYFPAHGKPGAQNIINEQQETEEDDEWKNVPISFRVFAENEKRIKQAKLEKLAKLKAEHESASQ